jgi:hypothetical protein
MKKTYRLDKKGDSFVVYECKRKLFFFTSKTPVFRSKDLDSILRVFKDI